jgi:L-fuconolactonase
MVTETDPGTWRSGWPTERLRPYADTALDAFGPGRLMFGSDWPVCTLAATYTEVAHGTGMLLEGLSAEEKQELLEGTATRVYGL